VPGQLDRIVELAREHLDMDLAYVSAFTGGKQVYEALSGDAESFGAALGDGPALETTYCARMVVGEIPNVIPDSAADARVRDLATTREGGIGAYIGVPLRLRDGTLYGTLCCLSHDAEPELDRRDVRFLSMLGDLLADELDANTQCAAERDRITALVEERAVTTALQPIVALDDGRVVGYEALSRFPAGYGPPDVVFAAAHEHGVGMALERVAVETAFALLPTLPADAYLALNLDPAVALTIAASLTPESDVVPWHRLVLEVTEHAPVDSYADLRDGLRPLRERGMRLAIDDAGAGYASMHHVVELQPDIVKVDRSLVEGLAEDAARRCVVRGFVTLGYELGARVLAEGVERPADLAAARRLGVGAAQGYLLARPSTDPADHARWAKGSLLPADDN
jgi:EAL domain-containing protein (putative c-di-GMP-specific phosphodiesterase class I)